MIRTIARHSNRKLYDAKGRRYVTLEDIVALVVAGETVRVREHASGHDATARVLAQALVDLVKRRAESLPASLMESLVRLAGGGSLETPASAPKATASRDLAAVARREAERIASDLVGRGRLGLEDALGLKRDVENALARGVESLRALSQKPFELRPGRAIRSLSNLGEELAALQTRWSGKRAAAAPPRKPRGRAARSPKR